MGLGGMLHVSRFGHVAYVRLPVNADGVHRNAFLMSLERIASSPAPRTNGSSSKPEHHGVRAQKKLCADKVLKGSQL